MNRVPTLGDNDCFSRLNGGKILVSYQAYLPKLFPRVPFNLGVPGNRVSTASLRRLC